MFTHQKYGSLSVYQVPLGICVCDEIFKNYESGFIEFDEFESYGLQKKE